MRKKFWAIKISIILAMCLAGYLVYDQLPTSVPSHWNFAGEPDGFTPKATAIWFFPALTLGLAILFPLIQKIDPKKEKYDQFEKVWEIFQLVLIAFFGFIYFLSLCAALNKGVDVSAWVMAGIGVLFVIMGNYMGKIRQNYFVGIKTPWTLNNEEVWNKTHRFGGWCFIAAGLIFVINAFVKQFPLAVFIAAIMVAAGLPIIYSYVMFTKIKKRNQAQQ